MLSGTIGTGVGTSARYAFSDRNGGVSSAPYDELNLGDHVGDDPQAVRENRRRAGELLGLAPDRVVFMEQVHGAEVIVVDRPLDPVPRCDALVTTERELCLVVMVADCVPVLLADAQVGVVAAVHAGRRGVQARILDRTLAAMAELGGRPERTAARLGPAVCGACYEVPADMQREVVGVAPAAAATTPAGTPGLDLRAGLVEVLRGQGVDDVELVGPCTREDAAFYSYRRDAVTGRFAGFGWLA